MGKQVEAIKCECDNCKTTIHISKAMLRCDVTKQVKCAKCLTGNYKPIEPLNNND